MALDILTPLAQGLTIRGQLDQRQANRDLKAQQQAQFDAQQAQQAQRAGLLQGAVSGGFGSQEFKKLAAFDVDAATKLKSLLQTDDQGLDAAFEDAKVFKNLLQNDPTGQSALQFGVNRLQAGQQQGRDMQHTQRFLKEVQSDPAAALNSIGSFLSIADKQQAKSVQSSKILEDGTIIEVLSSGGRQVISPSGDVLTGDDARQAIKNSSDQSFRRKKELKRLDQTIKTEQAKEGLLTNQQKSIQRGNIQRLGMLSNTASGRSSAIKKATKFKLAIEKGEAFTGAARRGAAFIPGVFTSQGQFDEEFNAFAEVAARQQLKASGETRPTDADVQGMKQAMFGIGRDEAVNIQLLNDFIEDQKSQNLELDQLIDASGSGNLSNFTFTPQLAQPRQDGVLHVDANGNKAMVFPDGSFEEVQ